jgi:MFS transporter, FSR family, fosmidomycin resistance protein
MTTASTISLETERPRPGRLRVLLAACAAHAVHDGLTDTLYVLLPIFQTVFGLNYAAVGMLRALYAGSMAGLQVPSAALVRRVGQVSILVAGTAVVGAGYMCLGAAGGLVTLALALVVGGIGSSTQHPIGSSLIASAYEGRRSRDALGTYNFAGDVGKVALPAIAACLIAVISWRATTLVIGIAGLAGACAILFALGRMPSRSAATAASRITRSGNYEPARLL